MLLVNGEGCCMHVFLVLTRNSSYIANFSEYLTLNYHKIRNQIHTTCYPRANRGEGTNSARLFTPGKRKALANSEVPGVWPPWLANERWSFLISRIWWTIRSSEHLRHPKKARTETKTIATRLLKRD